MDYIKYISPFLFKSFLNSQVLQIFKVKQTKANHKDKVFF